ncbi:hypothetical protein [Ktedonobacter racemifer]|uniref:Uncharacterized protein n=1 Tax=Ktedonobacter racemifer DSM 44963 TaxID=485913 RepID=D6U5I4_KTERA|nr:hypothetical protein [Ktedonobacter racemifer]EFH80245.1 hypothetical protein Krac_0825 [Ktedonobacter racemifer DSM 44963]
MTESTRRPTTNEDRPRVLLAPYELIALDNMLISYQTYLLLPAVMSREETHYFKRLMDLRRRIGRLLRPEAPHDDAVFDLVEDELETIEEAAIMFIQLFFRMSLQMQGHTLAEEIAQKLLQRIENSIDQYNKTLVKRESNGHQAAGASSFQQTRKEDHHDC